MISLCPKTAVSLVVMFLMVGAPTNAQDVLPEVVVTAERPAPTTPVRAAELSDEEIVGQPADDEALPDLGVASRTTVSASQLELNQIESIEELRGVAPNLNVSGASLRSFGDSYSMRGVANTPFFSNPAVVTMINGVPAGDAFAFPSDLYDLESVDVYRGPQGVYFGRNAEGGVIDITTMKPTNSWHGMASAAYGSYNTQEYQMAFRGPLVKDTLYLNVSAYHNLQDGFVYNSTVGDETDDRDALGGRFSLTWTPAPDWEIELGANADRYDDGTQRMVLTGQPRHVVASDYIGITQIDRNSQYLRIRKEFDWATMTSITSRSDWDMDPNTLDLDLSTGIIFPPVPPNPFPLLADFRSDIRLDQEQWSQEIRFDSKEPEPMAITGKGNDKAGAKDVVEAIDPESRVRWTGGLFYLTYENNGLSNRSLGTILPPIGTLPLWESTANRNTGQDVALFGNVTYRVTPEFDLTLGLRLEYSERSMDRFKTSNAAAGPLLSPFSGSTEFFAAQPMLSFEYQAHDQVSLFGSSGLSGKPGGYSAYTEDPSLVEFDQEWLFANELGVKTEALDGRLRARLTGFYYLFQDYQVERAAGANTTNYNIFNADQVTSKGVEFELGWEVIQGLVFTAGVGYTDITFDEFIDPVSGTDFAGQRVPFIADFNANLALDYRHSSGFLARLQYRTFGETFYNEANTVSQDAYGLLDATIGYEREHFGVYVYGTNLTDEYYYTLMQPDLGLGVPGGVVGQPASVGVKVKVMF